MREGGREGGRKGGVGDGAFTTGLDLHGIVLAKDGEAFKALLIGMSLVYHDPLPPLLPPFKALPFAYLHSSYHAHTYS